MQLNPHFLFNTHQAIVGLILQGDEVAAIDMIAALIELLRAVLTEEPQPLVPLNEEVAIMEKYLALQQIRFRLKVRVLVDLAPEAQPLPCNWSRRPARALWSSWHCPTRPPQW